MSFYQDTSQNFNAIALLISPTPMYTLTIVQMLGHVTKVSQSDVTRTVAVNTNLLIVAHSTSLRPTRDLTWELCWLIYEISYCIHAIRCRGYYSHNFCGFYSKVATIRERRLIERIQYILLWISGKSMWMTFRRSKFKSMIGSASWSAEGLGAILS